MSQFNDHMNKKAVALSYDEDVNAAPVVVASGSGYIAQKIVETARNNGIPVYEDNSLATMLSQLELGSEIPEQLYQAIVEIYVYFLNFAPDRAKAEQRQAENTGNGETDAGTEATSSALENEGASGIPTGLQGLNSLSDSPLNNPLPGNEDATTAARLAAEGIKLVR